MIKQQGYRYKKLVKTYWEKFSWNWVYYHLWRLKMTSKTQMLIRVRSFNIQGGELGFYIWNLFTLFNKANKTKNDICAHVLHADMGQIVNTFIVFTSQQHWSTIYIIVLMKFKIIGFLKQKKAKHSPLISNGRPFSYLIRIKIYVSRPSNNPLLLYQERNS